MFFSRTLERRLFLLGLFEFFPVPTTLPTMLMLLTLPYFCRLGNEGLTELRALRSPVDEVGSPTFCSLVFVYKLIRELLLFLLVLLPPPSIEPLFETVLKLTASSFWLARLYYESFRLLVSV